MWHKNTLLLICGAGLPEAMSCQGSRKEPPRQEQTPKPRVGQETGLAPGVPALMSWKQEEMAQHVKASKGKGLPMPAGWERAEQGGHRAQPLSTP